MAQLAVLGPLGELDLAHQARLDPVRALQPERRLERARRAREGVELAAELVEDLRRVTCTNFTSIAKLVKRVSLVRLGRLVHLVIADQQRAEPAARALRIREAADHELLPARALHLEPVLAAAWAIRLVAPLADDTLEPELARAREHLVPAPDDMLAVLDRRIAAREQLLEPDLALLERARREVIAADRERVEREVREPGTGAARVLQRLEAGAAVGEHGRGLPVEHERPRQRGERVREARELRGPVVEVAGEEPHRRARRLADREDAVAVELDLVQPTVAGGWGVGEGGELELRGAFHSPRVVQRAYRVAKGNARAGAVVEVRGVGEVRALQRTRAMRWLALAFVAACAGMHAPTIADDADVDGARPPPDAGSASGQGLGAHPTVDGVVFRVASTRATRIELELFDDDETFVRSVEMSEDHGVWSATVPGAHLYAYRAWGPNWPYDPAWQPGSTVGRIADVDSEGNRFNPNKLLIDPYAKEITHDPGAEPARSVVVDEHGDVGTKPTRPLRDDVLYEVHVRGLTERAGIACAGTFAGAATRADALAALGVTAVEFQPIQETSNDRNDADPASDSGDNYWGYSTLAYFAPDRRYACDQSAGGPTREFQAMVAAFHARGIKVLLDVVYNHTAEGGGGLISLRGLDNAGYYQLDAAGTGFTNSNGVGADVAANKPLAHGLIMDSLAYWADDMGVDGFRFDLAPVLGNVAPPGAFQFDGGSLPLDIAMRFARPADGGAGEDLIAEPWAVVAGSYMIGRFPIGWSEWNDHIRDTLRDAENKGGVSGAQLAARIAGSQDLFDARSPAASIDYLVSHDGLTLKDLYSCNGSSNGQAWPYGPSDGGTTDNRSWDHGGDATAQRQAVRTGLALLALSQGVPMITGGDEMLRSIRCNNNSYNLDSVATWLDPTLATTNAATVTYTSKLFAFRAAHPELHTGAWGSVAFHAVDGTAASSAYLADASKPVLGWMQGKVYVAYNRGAAFVTATLPPPPAGATWVRVADTSSGLEPDSFTEHVMQQSQYGLAARSLAVFEAR